MRKFFSQKSKHKTHQTLSTLTGSSNKEDDLLITKKGKPQATSSQSQFVTINSPTEILIDSTSNESLTSEIRQEEKNEKSKKLFVVVSGKNSKERKMSSFLSIKIF